MCQSQAIYFLMLNFNQRYTENQCCGAGSSLNFNSDPDQTLTVYDVPVLIIFFYLVMTGDDLAATDAIGVPGILPCKSVGRPAVTSCWLRLDRALASARCLLMNNRKHRFLAWMKLKNLLFYDMKNLRFLHRFLAWMNLKNLLFYGMKIFFYVIKIVSTLYCTSPI